MNTYFLKWFDKRFPYALGNQKHAVSKPEMKSKLEEAWTDGVQIGFLLGDAKATLEMVAKIMAAGLIHPRPLTESEIECHNLLLSHGIHSPVSHLL
jgi:hypothetical protein